MKKVVISTWTGVLSLNYGSALQTAALQEMVKKLGYSPITINNQYGNKKRKFSLNINCLRFKSSRGKEYWKTKRKFDSFFREEVNLSKICVNNDDAKEVAKEADILMCGSDAIWNSNWICPLFLWDFKEFKKKPKIAYAPSIQRGDVQYDMTNALKSFVAVSGREQRVGQLISQYTDLPVETVLDPTLTVSETYWEEKSKKRLIDEDYVLCYFLSDAEIHRLSVQDIKKKYGNIKVVYINTNWIDKRNGFTEYREEDYQKMVGPREFLSLIRYAKAVCTDSFHGMALSIAFHTEFYVFGREDIWKNGADYRFLDLFTRLGINNRFIEKNVQIHTLEKIDWSVVEQKLATERDRSIKYLTEAFDRAEEMI